MPAGSSASAGSLTARELLQRLGRAGCRSRLGSSSAQTPQLPWERSVRKAAERARTNSTQKNGFSFVPCLCPSDLGAGFQEQTQRCGMPDCPAPGIASASHCCVRAHGHSQGWGEAGLAPSWAFGLSGGTLDPCRHPRAWQSQPAIPTLHFRASGLAVRIVLLQKINQCFVS